MTRDAEHTPSPQSVVVPVETRECVRLLVQELTPDQGQSAGRAFGLAVALQAMLSAAPAPSSLAGGELLETEGARVGIVNIIERHISGWAGEHADNPYDAAVEIGRDIFRLAALSPEAPARDGVDALRTVLIKARSELAIQYCYSAGRMGIAGCYPELAEKYGGSTVVQEIDAALSLTPRHEAPAREGVALDKRIADAAERDRRERDKAFRGESYEPLTPTHEAPASPCFECGSTERTGTACKPCNPEITDPNFGHEAPAEGAGEDLLSAIDAFMPSAEVAFLWSKETPPADEVQRYRERYWAVKDALLRARSSAPEARGEALGNLLAVIHGDGGHRALEVGTKQAALEAEKIVAGLFAAPSADKLRELVEALEPFAREADSWPELADDDTLVLSAPDGTASAYDITMREIRRAASALAALKAEG